jgi:hypothetical protein
LATSAYGYQDPARKQSASSRRLFGALKPSDPNRAWLSFNRIPIRVELNRAYKAHNARLTLFMMINLEDAVNIDAKRIRLGACCTKEPPTQIE